MSLIQEGINKGLISFNEDNTTITYIHQNKKRSYKNPEEKVQAETFLKLALELRYPVENIKQFVTVTMGVDATKEADIVVYTDSTCKTPYIIVECKSIDISEQEFQKAINQAYSYGNALAGTLKYIWVTKGNKEAQFLFDKEKNERKEIAAIPAYGTDEIPPYLYVKGGGKQKYIDDKGKEKLFVFKDIREVQEAELTRVFRQAHDALWAGGQLNPSEAFDELDKLIFCKIWDEKYKVENGKLPKRKKGERYDFQVIVEKGKNEEEAQKKTNAALAKRVKAIYKAGKEFDKEVFKDDIRLSDEKIRTIVDFFESINIGKTDLDSKGRAFETFMGSFFRGEFGQYFTPRTIVQFVVEALPIDNLSFVLDTSCGSGGFLLHALDKVRRQADALYPDYETDADEREEWKEHWHSFAQNNLYGIEINEQIARTAKMNMIIHDDGHTNVISLDGLLNEKEVEKSTKNTGFKFNHFDFIITNPPFGSSIKNTEKTYLKNFILGNKQPDWLEYEKEDNYFTRFKSDDTTRQNQSTEVLFIEQCYNYLKEKGMLAIVIPDGILTNSSLQYVRDQIEEWFRIVAVVSMPQTAFAATGAGVKSSVLFLKKWTNAQTKKIENDTNKLKAQVLKTHKYYSTIAQWLEEKKEVLKNYTDYPHTYTNKKEEAKTERYKTWRAEVSASYTEKINELKEQMRDAYTAARKAYFIKNPKEDYPIFMAIAENIGYDAAGKVTTKQVSKSQLSADNTAVVWQEVLSHDLYNEEITTSVDAHDDKNILSLKRKVLPAGILAAIQDFINQVNHGNI